MFQQVGMLIGAEYYEATLKPMEQALMSESRHEVEVKKIIQARNARIASSRSTSPNR
jgi:hypothetical protein